MNIRLFRIYSVPIRISSPEFHVSDTCSLHGLNSVGWYVVTTYPLRRLHIFVHLRGYVLYTCPYMCTQLKIHDILNKVISLIVPKVSLIMAQFYFLLDGPGVSFTDGIVCPQASQMCCDTPNSKTTKISILLLLWFLP